MSQQLTPEKRPDKHGNIVTRWIRSFSNRDDPRLIPAPAAPAPVLVPAEPTRDEIIEAAKKLISSGTYENRVRPRAADLTGVNLQYLHDHSPELFEQVMESAKPATPEIFCWQQLLRYARVKKDLTPEQNLVRYRTALIVYPLVRHLDTIDPALTTKPNDMHNPMTVFTKVVGGLIYTRTLRGDIPSDENIEAAAIFAYLCDLHTSPDAKWEDVDGTVDHNASDDIKFIESRLPEVRAMLPEIRQRGTYDKEIIQILLDSHHGALREGEL